MALISTHVRRIAIVELEERIAFWRGSKSKGGFGSSGPDMPALGACPDYRGGEAKTRSAGRDLALSRPLAVR
jgi:hypothetical protein